MKNVIAFAFCLLMGTQPVSAQVRYLGWWDPGTTQGGNQWHPIPNKQAIAEQFGTVNVAMNVPIWDAYGLGFASAHGIKVIATWPLHLYRQIDQGTMSTPEIEWWLSQFVYHQRLLVGILVADEQDCNYRGARFPVGWTLSNCERARKQADANIALLRARLPGVPLWVNYTSAMASWFTSSHAHGRRLPSADWFSFDCYTKWDHCYGNKSVNDLVKGYLRHMRPHQRIVLIPPATIGFHFNDPVTVAAIGQRYWDYARITPRVVAVTPFIYWSSTSWVGGRDAPAIRQRWAAIGRSFLQGGW